MFRVRYIKKISLNHLFTVDVIICITRTKILPTSDIILRQNRIHLKSPQISGSEEHSSSEDCRMNRRKKPEPCTMFFNMVTDED